MDFLIQQKFYAYQNGRRRRQTGNLFEKEK